MKWADLPRRIGWRRSRRDLREDVEAEIAHHLAERMAELERAGYAPGAARREALRRFGDVTETRAVCVAADARRERRQGRSERLGEVVQDARHGMRQLGRQPAFAAVAVLTLALGIGANGAVFGVIDHVLLRPLPYAEPERVVTVWETDERAGRRLEASTGNFLDWRERAQSIAAMGMVEPYAYDVFGDGPPESVPAWRVGGEWFEALGVRPLLGRVFEARDHESSSPQVVLISEGYWQRRFGGSPDVLGARLQLDEGVAEVIGVLPASQLHPEAKDLWTPKHIRPQDASDRRSSYLPVVARLRPGVTLARAQAELDGVAAQLAVEYPQTNRDRGVALVPLREHLVGGVRPALVALATAVGLLLLIACTNLANLLLARGAERQRELSVRAALGAGRGRLARQMLTESAVLAALGAIVGVGVAWLALRALVAATPPDVVSLQGLALNLRIAAFLVGVSAVAVSLFATLPVLRLSRPELMAALRGAGRGGPSGRLRLRGALVTSGVAIALVLLIGAGLLTRSFVRLVGNESGFAHEQRAYVQVFLWDRNATPAERTLRLQQMLERFAAVPGVHSAGAVSALPLHPHAIDATARLQLTDAAAPHADEERRVNTTVATPGYFSTMGIPLLAGRGFTAQDRADSPPVAVVSDVLARAWFPDGNAVGSRILVGVMGAPVLREIVGVVGSVRAAGLDADPRPELFVPHAQHGTGSMTLVVHASGAGALLPALSRALLDVDPQQTVYSAGTVESLVSATLAERRFFLLTVALVSLAAFLLAVVGVYGLIAFWTGVRIREIGVRLALGARAGDIVRMVVLHAIRLVAPGIVLGLLGALAFARLLQHMMYGTSPADPYVYAQLAALMLLVAAAAAYLPARRAVRQDPLRSLRSDG